MTNNKSVGEMDVQMRPLFQNGNLKDLALTKARSSPGSTNRKDPPEPLNLELRKPDLLKFYKQHRAFPKEHLLAVMCELLDISTDNAEQYRSYLAKGQHYSAENRHRVCSALGHYCPVFAEVHGAYNCFGAFVRGEMGVREEVGLFNFAKAVFKYVFYGWFRMYPLPNYQLISSVELLLKKYNPPMPSNMSSALQHLIQSFFTFFAPSELASIIVDCFLSQHPRYMQHLLMNVLLLYHRELKANAQTIDKVWRSHFEYRLKDLLKRTRESLKGEHPILEVSDPTPSYEESLEYEIKYPAVLKQTALRKQQNYLTRLKNEQTEKEIESHRERLNNIIEGIKVDRENYGRTVEAMNRDILNQRYDADPQETKVAREAAQQIERVKAMVKAVAQEPTKPVVSIPKQRLRTVKYDLNDIEQDAVISLNMQKHIGQQLQPVILSINKAHQEHLQHQSKLPNRSAPSPLEEELVELLKLKGKLEDEKMRVAKEKLNEDFERQIKEEALAAREQERYIIEKEGAKANKQFRKLVQEIVGSSYNTHLQPRKTMDDLYIDKQIERLQAQIESKKQILKRLN